MNGKACFIHKYPLPHDVVDIDFILVLLSDDTFQPILYS